jgi:hypothetical protein
VRAAASNSVVIVAIVGVAGTLIAGLGAPAVTSFLANRSGGRRELREAIIDYLWVIDRAVDHGMTLGVPRQTRFDRWLTRVLERSLGRTLLGLIAQGLFPAATRRRDRLNDDFYRASHRLRLATPARSVTTAMDAAEAHLRRWHQVREDAWLEAWKPLRRQLQSACQEAVGGKPLPAGAVAEGET